MFKNQKKLGAKNLTQRISTKKCLLVYIGIYQ